MDMNAGFQRLMANWPVCPFERNFMPMMGTGGLGWPLSQNHP